MFFAISSLTLAWTQSIWLDIEAQPGSSQKNNYVWYGGAHDTSNCHNEGLEDGGENKNLQKS